MKYRRLLKNSLTNVLFCPAHTSAGSRKRNRSNWQQRNVLERVFQSTPYPDLATRNELAEKLGKTVGMPFLTRFLGMNPRKIQVWFQNRRTKLKSQKAEGQSLDTIAQMEDVNKLDPTTGNSLLYVAAAAGKKYFHIQAKILSRFWVCCATAFQRRFTKLA